MKKGKAQNDRKRKGKPKPKSVPKKPNSKVETKLSPTKHQEERRDQKENEEEDDDQDTCTCAPDDVNCQWCRAYTSDEMGEVRSFAILQGYLDWEDPGEDREDLIEATCNLVQRFDDDRAIKVFIKGWQHGLSQKYQTLDQARVIPISSYRPDDKVPKWARMLAFCEDHELDALDFPHELDDCPLPGARDCETCEAKREERRSEKKEGSTDKQGEETTVGAVTDSKVPTESPKSHTQTQLQANSNNSSNRISSNSSSSNNSSSRSSTNSDSIHNNNMPNTHGNSTSTDSKGSSNSSSDTHCLPD
jgi:hypothetical protein